MSAMAQLKVSFEEEAPLEASCREELRKALRLIEQLQKESRDLRDRLAEKNQLAEQKRLLLSSTFAHEQILRSELVKASSLAMG